MLTLEKQNRYPESFFSYQYYMLLHTIKINLRQFMEVKRQQHSRTFTSPSTQKDRMLAFTSIYRISFASSAQHCFTTCFLFLLVQKHKIWHFTRTLRAKEIRNIFQ